MHAQIVHVHEDIRVVAPLLIQYSQKTPVGLDTYSTGDTICVVSFHGLLY
jgi:hypothetical protein